MGYKKKLMRFCALRIFMKFLFYQFKWRSKKSICVGVKGIGEKICSSCKINFKIVTNNYLLNTVKQGRVLLFRVKAS